MKSIDEKIDIILRQKLLMGYKPELNLNENIKKTSEDNKLLTEAPFLIWPILKAAGYTIGGITAWYWGKQALDARGRNRPLDELYSYFSMCDKIPNITKGASEDIANTVSDNLKIAYDPAAITNPSLNPGKIIKGITHLYQSHIEGKVLEDVYGTLKELRKFSDFCLTKEKYWEKENIQLYTVMKKEHVKADELYQVNEIIGKLFDVYITKLAKAEVPCISNLIFNQFRKKATDPFPANGYLINSTNPKVQKHRGIVLTSLFPDNRTGFNWHFADRSKYGHTSCDPNGCVKFIDSSGESYYVGQCYKGQNPVPKCLSNLLYNYYGVTPNSDLPREGILINSTQNPKVDVHGGIILKSYYPSSTYGTNWYFQDRSSYGKTICDDDGCVKFINTSGETFYIHSCYEKHKNDTNTATTTTNTNRPTSYCPTGYAPPTDGIYKICSSGQPVVEVQRCLNINPDGKFGRRTLNALRTQKGVSRFTAQDVATLCRTNPTPNPVPNPPRSNYDWLEGEDIGLQNF